MKDSTRTALEVALGAMKLARTTMFAHASKCPVCAKHLPEVEAAIERIRAELEEEQSNG